MENEKNDDSKLTFEKIILAGVGAIATSTDKAIEILNDLVNKGELTVEKGKVINQELEVKAKEEFNKQVMEPVSKKTGFTTDEKTTDDYLDSLSEEQLNELKEKINNVENKRAQ